MNQSQKFFFSKINRSWNELHVMPSQPFFTHQCNSHFKLILENVNRRNPFVYLLFIILGMVWFFPSQRRCDIFVTHKKVVSCSPLEISIFFSVSTSKNKRRKHIHDIVFFVFLPPQGWIKIIFHMQSECIEFNFFYMFKKHSICSAGVCSCV